jgi:hypothetical protein
MNQLLYQKVFTAKDAKVREEQFARIPPLPPFLRASRFAFVLIRVYPRRSAIRFCFSDYPQSRDVSDSGDLPWYVFLQMEKKIFWLLFTVLGAVMGLLLPLWWNLALTLPLLVLCWWVVYRSGWFE